MTVTISRVSDTPQLQAARAALVSAVRLYAPVHNALSQDATRALETAMDNLQAAAVAAAQVPATPPPVPASAQPPKAVAQGDGHVGTAETPQDGKARPAGSAGSPGKKGAVAPQPVGSPAVAAPGVDTSVPVGEPHSAR